MKSTASDVNTIFAYADITHKFNKISIAFFNDVKNGNYILLKYVKTSFHYTYSDRLKTMGNMVLLAVNEIKEELKKRKVRKPASPFLRTTLLNKRLQVIMEKNKEFDSNDYTDFKDLMLAQYPLLVLLENKEKSNEFRIKFTKEADKIASEKFESFLNFLVSKIIKIKRVDEKRAKEWQDILIKAKQTNIGIFQDPNNDDILLSAEFLTVVENRRLPINFGTLDKNLTDSLDYIKKENKIKCGDIIFLLHKYRKTNP